MKKQRLEEEKENENTEIRRKCEYEKFIDLQSYLMNR